MQAATTQNPTAGYVHIDEISPRGPEETHVSRRSERFLRSTEQHGGLAFACCTAISRWLPTRS